MRYLIVGGSIAGASAIRAIRANDPGGDINLVTAEKPFYYRPLIPFVVEGSWTVDDISFPGDMEKDLGVKVVHEKAASLEPGKKELVLSSGERLNYDTLLVATGSAPIVPDIPGAEGALELRTLDDAVKMKAAASGAGSAVVLGGGFVGIKAAAALLKLGLKATVVEKLPQVLSPRLDEKGSNIVRERLEESGIKIITSETAAEFHPGSVKLGSGDTLEADLAVIAIGTRPNTGWLEGSGLKTEQALVVDENLQCSAPDVYAAGDVVQALELIEQKPAVSALWTNAVEMGSAAGSNMAGNKTRYAGFLQVMNATELEGIPMVSAGAVTGEGDVFTENGSGEYRKLVFRDDRLVGAIFMGDLKNAGIYTNLIRNQRPLGKLKDKAVKGTLTYLDFMPEWSGGAD